MDSVALLAASLAVMAYPGGIFALLLAAAVVERPRWQPWAIDEVVGGAAALLAAGLAPLPGAPATVLPPDAGVPSNLLVETIALAVALALLSPARWTPWRVTAALAVLASALALACVGSTASLPTLVILPGTTVAVSRGMVGVLMVAALPVVHPLGEQDRHRRGAALLSTAWLIVALSLIAPTVTTHMPALLGAATVGVVVALLGRAQRRAGIVPAWAWAVGVVVTAVIASALLLLDG